MNKLGEPVRYRKVQFTPSFLLGIILQDHEFHCKVTHGLPKGTKFISMHTSVTNLGILDVIVEHESFGLVGPNQPIPLLEIEMSRL